MAKRKPAKPKPKVGKQDVNKLLADAIGARIGVRPTRERRLHPIRLWRFDLVYPSLKIAIEVDGSQHGAQKNRRRDAEKRNAAVEAGYRVLSFPADCVLTKCRLPLIVEQVYRVVCGENDFEMSAHVLNG